MNVAGNAPKLEAAQQPASASKSDQAAPKSDQAAQTAKESIALPFVAILKWLTRDEPGPSAAVPEKKKDKPSKNSDVAAIVELPASPVAVKPPISLSIALTIADGSRLQPKVQASDAPSGAEPVQPNIVQSELETATTDVRSLMAFALTLSQNTPGPENELTPSQNIPGPENQPLKASGPIKESALPQTIAGDTSVRKQEVTPGSTTAAAKADPVREIQEIPAQKQEQHSKDTPPEKQPEALHVPEQRPVLQTAPEVAGVKSDKSQSPASPPPTRSETPKAELKTETNATVRPPPAREISLRVAGGDCGSVDLRISERAGKVHVDVRTADGSLARSLRADLGDLVGRLENRGLKTETWTPGTQATVNSGGAETGSEQDSEHTPGGWSGQQNQRDNRQGRSKQHPKPDWIEEWKIKEIHDNNRS